MLIGKIARDGGEREGKRGRPKINRFPASVRPSRELKRVENEGYFCKIKNQSMQCSLGSEIQGNGWSLSRVFNTELQFLVFEFLNA